MDTSEKRVWCHAKNCFSILPGLGKHLEKNRSWQSPNTKTRRASEGFRFRPECAAGRFSCWVGRAPPSRDGRWRTGTWPKRSTVWKRRWFRRGPRFWTGVCRGKILVLGRARPTIARRQVADGDLAEEINRLEKALVQTRHQILDVQRKVSEGMGAQEGGIFEAHLLVLEDRTLLDEVVRVIQQQKVNAEHAFHTVAERYAAMLSAIEDEYLRERASDMRDVTMRVLNNLLGLEEDADLRHLKEPCIIISHDLTPSNTAQLDKRNVLGFATDVGSKTSHTAIIDRKSTRLNSSHLGISYAVFCLKK